LVRWAVQTTDALLACSRLHEAPEPSVNRAILRPERNRQLDPRGGTQ
jgi:hypothetical protein